MGSQSKVRRCCWCHNRKERGISNVRPRSAHSGLLQWFAPIFGSASCSQSTLGAMATHEPSSAPAASPAGGVLPATIPAIPVNASVPPVGSAPPAPGNQAAPSAAAQALMTSDVGIPQQQLQIAAGLPVLFGTWSVVPPCRRTFRRIITS
jgi:hypothetical protein